MQPAIQIMPCRIAMQLAARLALTSCQLFLSSSKCPRLARIAARCNRGADRVDNSGFSSRHLCSQRKFFVSFWWGLLTRTMEAGHAH
jgi:hypothetical protein